MTRMLAGRNEAKQSFGCFWDCFGRSSLAKTVSQVFGHTLRGKWVMKTSIKYK